MKHGTLVLPVDRARQFIDLIGAHTKMQFEDMNARDMHRPYKKYIQRIDEMERILRFLMDELTKVPGAEVIKNNMDSFLDNSDEYKLDELEARLKQIHQDFIQFKENNAKLTGRRNAALEERYVVQTAIASMAQLSASSRASGGQRVSCREESDQFEFAASRSLLDDEEGGGRRTLETMFSNIAGVIPQADQDRFARTLFRATRGNTFTHFQQIFEPMQDPKTGREVHKSVFVIYFQDTRLGSSMSSAMSEKISKICSSYGVNTYRWPTSRAGAEEMRLSLQVQVEDQERLLKAHESFVRSEAASLLEAARQGGNSLVEEWRLFCKKEKAIYATLNLFEGQMNLRADCWFPASEEDEIRRMLIQRSAGQGHSSAMLVVDRSLPRKSPPTYIRKNEFTAVVQDMVDTYGTPRYGEVNPALFTTVTFPFLFGIMFGDVGHGLMVLLVGVYAIWKADKLKFSFPDLYYARYTLFMMGFFAVYMGFLYNDFFCIGLNLFGSRWEAPPAAGAKVGEVHAYTPNYDTKNLGGDGPYPFGIDPAWHGAENELIYMNSMKMKLSVIVGVVQMAFGLLLRVSNALHERNLVDLCFECVPMMVFMLCFFGFMDYMILHKWVNPIDDPPSIINAMISMGMFTADPNPMFGSGLPTFMMVLTMLSVPILLVPKPAIKLMQHKAQVREMERIAAGQGHGHGLAGRGMGRPGPAPLGDVESLMNKDEDDEEKFDFSEIVIHQVIETIEYVLGTVSHTASYLRLWALSLAHQQLSVVFFGMTLRNGMTCPFPFNVILIYYTFSMWFMCTVGILLGMDTMECSLHTLRLHWIEFQSKFFMHDGYPFVPFRHRDVLVAEE